MSPYFGAAAPGEEDAAGALLPFALKACPAGVSGPAPLGFTWH